MIRRRSFSSFVDRRLRRGQAGSWSATAPTQRNGGRRKHTSPCCSSMLSLQRTLCSPLLVLSRTFTRPLDPAPVVSVNARESEHEKSNSTWPKGAETGSGSASRYSRYLDIFLEAYERVLNETNGKGDENRRKTSLSPLSCSFYRHRVRRRYTTHRRPLHDPAASRYLSAPPRRSPPCNTATTSVIFRVPSLATCRAPAPHRHHHSLPSHSRQLAGRR